MFKITAKVENSKTRELARLQKSSSSRVELTNIASESPSFRVRAQLGASLQFASRQITKNSELNTLRKSLSGKDMRAFLKRLEERPKLYLIMHI